MKQPFFVVGAGRSGSTYLHVLLASHPRIALTNEGHIADFLSFCTKYASVPAYEPIELAYFERVTLHGMIAGRHSDRFAELFRRRAVDILEEFYREEFADKQFTHWGDKLPSPATAPEIQSVYPNAKFIVLMRDPRDGWCSLRTYREREDIREFHPALLDLSVEDWSRDWNNSYRGFLDYLTHTYLLRYEDLVGDPRGGLDAALEFLGLTGADEITDAAARYDTFGGHGTARNPAASIGRWRAELSHDDIRVIETVCGDLMREHRYELADG